MMNKGSERVRDAGRYESWGRYPRARHDRVVVFDSARDAPDFSSYESDILPYGCGRSYGDCCLNEGGVLVDMRGLNRILSVDADRRVIRCESGVTLERILDEIVPKGLFLPVTPGTRFVTVGGAIANDVHGKNHHVSGTFGRHVTRMEILRTSGERIVCSRSEHRDLFFATIGGMGLTGLILWAEFDLIEMAGEGIVMDALKFRGLDEFVDLSERSAEYPYTVAWLDCSAGAAREFRGLFMRGSHAEVGRVKRERSFNVPFDLPGGLINRWVIGAFNSLYFNLRPASRTGVITHYAPFFYPLDKIENWNRVYGPAGFLQYQCVIPPAHTAAGLLEIMSRMRASGISASLAVLKKFGDFEPAGLLSFSRPGTTLALDFRNTPRVHSLLDGLDAIVLEAGGAVYPAKDARMRPETYQRFYPHWRDMLEFKDPKISSSLWRRVTGVSL